MKIDCRWSQAVAPKVKEKTNRYYRVFTQIVGSANRKQLRGLPLTVRAEVSSLHDQNDGATYTWTVASEDSATAGFPPLTLPSGRDPSVLTLPPNTLGYAGSVYAFRVDLDGGTQSAVSATATGQAQRFRH